MAALASGLVTGCAHAPSTAHADRPPAAETPSESEDCYRVESKHFSFRSDPWINLHLLLFQWARSEAERLPGDRRPAVEVGERDGVSELAEEDRQAWDRALGFYAGDLTARDLLRDRGLVALRDPLGAVACSDAAAGISDLDAELRSVLEGAMPVYRRHWWPTHHASNVAWIESIVPRLRGVETALVESLARAYGGEWPASRVRVDVTGYATWHGAYTTNRPDVITVTSTSPHHADLNGVEVLFHEASHGSFFEQPLLAGLDDAFEPRDLSPPDGLSHVIQFVTPGVELRSLMTDEERERFQPYAERLGLYARNALWNRHRTLLEKHWLPFLSGETDRVEALAGIVTELAPKN